MPYILPTENFMDSQFYVYDLHGVVSAFMRMAYFMVAPLLVGQLS